MYHWLVVNGLWRDVLATVVALGGARIVAWNPLRKHFRNQGRIGDLLDTTKPGGLTDILQAELADQPQPPNPTGP